MVSKKGDPKKTQVYKSIVNLVSVLPSHNIYTWLRVPELWSLLVSGGVAAEINDNDVRYAMVYHSRGQFESRHFGENKEKYYRHASRAGDPNTPCTRGTVPLELSSNYFQHPSFQNDVKVIGTFFSSRPVTESTPCSKKRQAAEDSSVDTPTSQLLCCVTPPTSQLPCTGWSGPAYQKLIAVSLKDCIDQKFQSTGNVTSIPEQAPLARLFSSRKDYSKFVIESTKAAACHTTLDMDTNMDTASSGFTIHAASCQGYSADGLLCPCCKGLLQSLAHINHHAKKEMNINGDVHVTSATLQLMGPDNTAAIVSAICDKKDRQLHNLQKKMRRIEMNMESANYKQFVYNEDDRYTLLRAVRATLPIAKTMFGEGSIHFNVFKESFCELIDECKRADGKKSTGNRYPS
jgi:hypothetical protein